MQTLNIVDEADICLDIFSTCGHIIDCEILFVQNVVETGCDAFLDFFRQKQVRVQFMIVWQRYSRNGSCRVSSRSSVASSRLSTIHR